MKSDTVIIGFGLLAKALRTPPKLARVMPGQKAWIVTIVD